MKKHILLLSLVMVLITSCKDFLKETPKGLVSSETFFSDVSSLPLTVNALYWNFNSAFNQSAYLATYMGGDDITTQSGSNKQAFREFDQFAVTNSNDRMANTWGACYNTIRAANSILFNLEINPATKEIKDQCAGQAYFMRAISYFFLTRTWGKVPIVTTMEPDYKLAKSSIADVYTLILADLKNAETLLPKVWTDGTYQGVRPSQGAAKTLLANVYLTMAGWPLKQEANYALAAAKAKEVIDSETDYGYQILPNVNDLWTWANNYSNKEVVFGCYFRNDIATWTWQNGNMGSPLPSRADDEGGWTDYYAEITFFNNFPAGARKDATYQTKISKNGILVNWDDATTNHKHPYFKKYQDAQYITDWWSSRTVQIIRYAEVLLTYAEAKAMSGGPDVLAYTCINRIRNRAGLTSLPVGLGSTEFRDAVVAERGWEFAGGEPASRWFDLIRLERVEAVTHNRNAAEIPLVKQPSKADYLMPIPASEVAINPKLGEN